MTRFSTRYILRPRELRIKVQKLLSLIFIPNLIAAFIGVWRIPYRDSQAPVRATSSLEVILTPCQVREA